MGTRPDSGSHVLSYCSTQADSGCHVLCQTVPLRLTQDVHVMSDCFQPQQSTDALNKYSNISCPIWPVAQMNNSSSVTSSDLGPGVPGSCGQPTVSTVPTVTLRKHL